VTTITLHVYNGREYLEVAMPASTTVRYAVARCIEALGGDPGSVRGYLATFNISSKLPPSLQEDDIIEPWDGQYVGVCLPEGGLYCGG